MCVCVIDEPQTPGGTEAAEDSAHEIEDSAHEMEVASSSEQAMSSGQDSSSSADEDDDSDMSCVEPSGRSTMTLRPMANLNRTPLYKD